MSTKAVKGIILFVIFIVLLVVLVIPAGITYKRLRRELKQQRKNIFWL
jgi:hypothetical protein